jgi:hypothetical protein
MNHFTGKLSFFAILLYLTACTKSAAPSNDNGMVGLTGKWNLINDSIIQGVGPSNHLVGYTGAAGDYFNFGTNGYAYTKEGALLDTLTYRMVTDTSIIISSFGLIINGIPDTSTVAGLAGSNSSVSNSQIIVIESPFFLIPAGEFWRKVTLSR